MVVILLSQGEFGHEKIGLWTWTWKLEQRIKDSLAFRE